MGSSSTRLLVLISLLLNSFSALAQYVNTTLHSTHPQVTYAPESCCMRNGFNKCVKRYDPFTMSRYVDANSMDRTFFQTSSWGNEPWSSNMKRRVEVRLYGRAVYVYGPPRTKLDNRPGQIQISLDGSVVTTIDLEVTYNEGNVQSLDPQLMYHWEGTGGDAFHTLEITLLDAGSRPIRGFGFDSVVTTSLEPLKSPRYELSNSEQIKAVEIHDTNFVTTFTPSYAWRTVSAPSPEGIRTSHGTSNELAYNYQSTSASPVVEFTAQCAALVVYGASPAQLEETFAEGFRHGHLQICQQKDCEYIDAHQAYLHVPKRLWHEPVLLYSNDRMSPRALQTVRMSLLDPSSPVGHRWVMSFSRAVCSQVVPKWPWTHHGRYSTHLVQFDRFSYAPSYLFGAFSPWTRTERYGFAPATPYWFSGAFHDMPSWSTTVRGHDIKIFVPSPTLFPELKYANVRCCIDEKCHYPDIERWLSGVTEAHSDVLLVHYRDLNLLRDHHISITAVRRDDEVGDKFIAVSRVEYQQVEIVTPRPSPTTSRLTQMPSKTGNPQVPTPTKPVQNMDHGILAALSAAITTILVVLVTLAAFVIAIVALVAAISVSVIVIIESIETGFALVRSYQRRQGERERLIPHPQPRPPPPPGNIYFPPVGPRPPKPVINSWRPRPSSGVNGGRTSSPVSSDLPLHANSDRGAPPSYDSCVIAPASASPFPQAHDPITTPASPPHLAEPGGLQRPAERPTRSRGEQLG